MLIYRLNMYFVLNIHQFLLPYMLKDKLNIQYQYQMQHLLLLYRMFVSHILHRKPHKALLMHAGNLLKFTLNLHIYLALLSKLFLLY